MNVLHNFQHPFLKTGNISLVDITRSLVRELKGAPAQTVDLNELAVRFAVDKRRLYDVVNILEGISLIKRRAAQRVSWNSDTERGNHAHALKSDLHWLDDKERELDRLIHMAKSDMQAITYSSDADRYAYVTEKDIKGIESLLSDTVLVIKAPPRTTLEIPTPNNVSNVLNSRHSKLRNYSQP
ncbi:predicted protein [Nematostella vectensis]|uniref:E2F/DP family winged-helix DNA-binding domain-containing protein n=1 Tax=Nematostella vectensis TaxID=45351 RepID=A7RXG8_NEMVE|nr:predicted protein [Nematostella vectensis]|eukprot:XP_001635906.1 predicted protein [Nematostella vectensis]